MQLQDTNCSNSPNQGIYVGRLLTIRRKRPYNKHLHRSGEGMKHAKFVHIHKILVAVLWLMLPVFLLPAAMAQTYGEAIRWYEKAAKDGSSAAQYLLGYKLETGTGGPRDLFKAARWYRSAAAQSHPMAQFRLGRMYQNGSGVPLDLGKAVSLYLSAASRGVAEAALNVAYLLERGLGVDANLAKAKYYYRLAAKYGLGDARLNLGLLLASSEDRAAKMEGCLWLLLATEQNIPGAASARDAVIQVLTPSEVAIVKQRKAAYNTSHAPR